MILVDKCAKMLARGMPNWADNMYKRMTRLTVGDFDELHSKYGVLLEHHSQCKAICSLAILLAWLAHGHTFQQLGVM